MSAVAALHVVKQIQALVEGPETPEMRNCVGQLLHSLQYFLDHPDARVRLGAARSLVKLVRGYREDWEKADQSKAKAALVRLEWALEDGARDGDETEAMAEILAEVMGEPPRHQPARVPAAAGSSADPSSGGAGAGGADHKEDVVVKVGDDAEAKLKAAILERVVAIAGVKCVTFEGPYVIVTPLSPAVAADAGFPLEILAAVRAAQPGGAADEAELVRVPGGSAGGGGGGGGGSSSSACKAEEPAATAAATEPASTLASAPASAATAAAAAMPAEEDEEDVEPAYLDDDEDEDDDDASAAPGNGLAGGAGRSPAASFGGGTVGAVGPNWSFFSQTHWISGRKMQEYDEDPTISARLAKAKQREEERRREEKSRLGKVSSWLFGGGT